MKTIVITGGSSGIGKAIADRYANDNADVTILDVKTPQNETGVQFLECDVADEHAVEAALRGIADIDVLILAAGVTSQTDEPTDDEMRLMDAVNVDEEQ
jgi:3-oxoacyl-[acyl-carrier protein] reductase